MTDRNTLVAVVSVGDELVTGQTVDTNSAWISRRLTEFGVTAVRHVTVADDAAATRAAISDSARLARWVIVTGGLGPTPDDLTREAAAELLGEPLQERAEALEMIRRRFEKMQREMVELNRVQAMFPPSARIIPNEWGTAPGLEFDVPGPTRATCFCLPGVPGEMRGMFEAAVAPAIQNAVGNGVLLLRAVHTFGIGESDLAERLGDLLARDRNPQVGTSAAEGSVSVRIYARAASAGEALRMLDETTQRVTGLLGDVCFGMDGQTLQSVVGERLRAAGRTLAAAESCTGGLLAKLVTDVPGSSDYFRESWVCYSNEAKVRRLGVSPDDLQRWGAVSEAVAKQLAEGARREARTDWAVSITGVAGPGGGSAEKPVGLVYIGLAGPGGTDASRHLFVGDRELVRLRAARTALNRLRVALK